MTAARWCAVAAAVAAPVVVSAAVCAGVCRWVGVEQRSVAGLEITDAPMPTTAGRGGP